MSNQKKSKKEMVADFLQKNKSITSWEAIKLFRATRLSSIIFNLRKSGWKIVTNPIKSKQGSVYAKYVFVSAPKKNLLGRGV